MASTIHRLRSAVLALTVLGLLLAPALLLHDAPSPDAESEWCMHAGQVIECMLDARVDGAIMRALLDAMASEWMGDEVGS